MSELAALQTTLGRSVRCVGVGLHSGAPARLRLRPAPAGAGVTVRRLDIAGPEGVIPVTPEAVRDTRLCTVLANAQGVTVATVEHVFAALAAMGVDNVGVEIDGPEIPAVDGSAAPFVTLIAQAGVQALPARRRVVRVTRPLEVRLDGARVARFEPSDRFDIDVTIDFDRGGIGRQRYVGVVDAATFRRDVAAARTFAFANEVEALRAAGLARGGSLDNCIVLEGETVLNPGGLRFPDEFVRHKALDAIGDLFVAGFGFQGRYIAERPGHELNNEALRALMADPTAHELSWARGQGRDALVEDAALIAATA